jgi:hypothetical protein
MARLGKYSSVSTLLKKTFEISKRKNTRINSIMVGDLGDALHVYGVSLTPVRLHAHLIQIRDLRARRKRES